MKYKVLFGLLAGLGLILALSGGVAPVSSQDGAPAAAPAGPSNPEAVVGTTITYQGHLTKNGSPVNATCDLIFLLYDAASGGNYVTEDSVTTPVSDGHFSAVLNFGEGAFNGAARWLQIHVRCPSGVGSYTQLSGRVALTAVPYAHSLRPGATVIGSQGTTLHVTNSAEDGVAVLGEATSLATASDYQAYGGKFTSRSRGGIGVYGEDNNSGDYSSGYGVYGKSNSTWGYGVYGENSSPDGYGVYSAGDAHVQGKLTWQAKTSYISVPAAAFIPRYLGDVSPTCHNPQYANDGDRLTIYPSTCPVYDYVAPVQLPHGATVTAMSFNYFDYAPNNDGSVGLYRDWSEQMAYAVSSGDSGEGAATDTSIDYATVDNLNHTYYLRATLVDWSVQLCYVVIEYTIEEPY